MAFNTHPLAKMRTLLHRNVVQFIRVYYNKIWGTDIGHGSRISLKARIDKTNPKGVHIGEYTIITPDVHIFTHDFVHGRHVDTYIGSYCFIGATSVILPGVRIGDHCIIGAGSIVANDIPPNSIAVGNPARVIRSGIKTGKWGTLPEHHINQGITL